MTKREERLINQLNIKYGIKKGSRFHFNYVKEYFAIFEYKLLSKTYKNDRTHLKYLCPNSHEHQIIFSSFRRGSRCYYCSHGNYAPQDVTRIVENAGYKLIGSYIGKTSNDVIKLKCPNNHIHKTLFKRFSKGQRCKKCLADTLRMDFNVVKKKMAKKGITVLSPKSDYKVAKSKLKCQCNKGHKFKTSWDVFSKVTKASNKSNGCRECGRINNSLDGAYNYKGHRTAKIWVRTKLYDWKQDALKTADYTCFVSGKRGEKLEVHHVENFSDIFYKAVKELDLPDYKYTSMYLTQELLDLEIKIRELHRIKGVVLLKHVHKLFHNKYGITNNTWEQIIEFKEDYRLKAINKPKKRHYNRRKQEL